MQFNVLETYCIAFAAKQSDIQQVVYLTKLDFANYASVPCGLVARIPGFHPGGPGSIPGMETF